jgi:hypothetical protein
MARQQWLVATAGLLGLLALAVAGRADGMTRPALPRNRRRLGDC